jgi:hypothetical protein
MHHSFVIPVTVPCEAYQRNTTTRYTNGCADECAALITPKAACRHVVYPKTKTRTQART